MASLTKEFLNNIGVQMDEQTFNAFSDHFDESLHEHVVNEIMDSLNESKTQELARLRETNSEAVWEWLQINVPNLSEIVRQEVDKILAEVIRTSDHL